MSRSTRVQGRNSKTSVLHSKIKTLHDIFCQHVCWHSFLFYLFWEVVLLPMYFLIGIWGGKQRIYATTKFFLYTLAGSLLMLVGIIALYLKHYSITGILTFDVVQLAKVSYPASFQFWIFLSFFIAFAIKVPIFPYGGDGSFIRHFS